MRGNALVVGASRSLVVASNLFGSHYPNPVAIAATVRLIAI
ncbi:hypothetical protein [Plectonema radiosum]|nr:hypothetical protein [Plectonema radiosum]